MSVMIPLVPDVKKLPKKYKHPTMDIMLPLVSGVK
jgi:hypothetical protein